MVLSPMKVRPRMTRNDVNWLAFVLVNVVMVAVETAVAVWLWSL